MIERIREAKFKMDFILTPLLLVLLIIVSSCDSLLEAEKVEGSRNVNARFEGTNSALIYRDNPTFLTGTTGFNIFPDIEDELTSGFITSNSTLTTPCSFTQNISSTQTLTRQTSNDCMSVLNDDSADTIALEQTNGSWAYPIHSDEFYQVNSFFHVNKIFNRFFSTLSKTHKQVHFESNRTIPPATKANLIDTSSFFLTRSGATNPLTVFSKCPITDPNAPFNAFFSPADNTICLGFNAGFPTFRMAQDPSVIYHEIGHALVKAMMNQRNVTSGINPFTFSSFFDAHPFESDLGTLGYNEAAGINEGIADYFSFYMNQRTRVGEWGLGRAQGIHRPIKEDDIAHFADIDATSGRRLSYPQFIYYNPALESPTRTAQIEDVHNTGGVVTHYFVALTEALQNTCSLSSNPSLKHQESTDLVFLAINETLAELGDLTAKGSDVFNPYSTVDATQFGIFFTNLNDEQSFLWTHFVNPPSFRRFFRIMGKNILHHISGNVCPSFTKDDSERLLDDYGLLLFRSYEDRGNGFDINGNFQVFYQDFAGKQVFAGQGLSPVDPTLIGSTQVNEANRRNTILVSKDFINLREDEAAAFIFDRQSEIRTILSQLTFEGANVQTTPDLTNVNNNNNNLRVSPGEIIGIALNLFNTSNSPMGGVQVLANDWDHMKLNTPTNEIFQDADPNNDLPFNFVNRNENDQAISNSLVDGFTAVYSPCQVDNFPLESENGISSDGEDSTQAGNCSHISKTNYSFDNSTVIAGQVQPKHELDAPQPICLVQFNDENETRWVSQDVFRERGMTRLEDSQCLNNPSMSGNEFNPNECLIRFLPGANQSHYGRIDAQRNWSNSVRGGSTELATTFSSANISLMEINRNIPPGTRFNCRFRVRFSNCSDCYDNLSAFGRWNDFQDFEYSGHEPFKVINFQFQVGN